MHGSSRAPPAEIINQIGERELDVVLLESILQTCGERLSRSERILAIFLMKKVLNSLASCCLFSCGGKTGVLGMFKRYLLTLKRCLRSLPLLEMRSL